MLADFHFIRPLWLLTFIPAVVLLGYIWRNKLSAGNWQAVCDAELLPFLLQDQTGGTQKKRFLSYGITTLATFLAIIALAGPTWQRLPAPAFRNDSALVIALDLSKSMDAADITPSRLIRARYKIADLLKLRKDGQTALIAYAGDAFVVTPLTTDSETIANQLPALTTEIMPSPGSNSQQALAKAVDLFKQAGLPKGQIILVTDGVEPEKAANFAEKIAGDHYTVSVLAVGTADGAPIALPDGGFLKDASGTIVIPKLEVSDLFKLASAGGGIYQAISTDDNDVKALLASIDNNAPQQGLEDNKLTLEQWDDKGPWMLLAVLPFAALLFRKGLLCWALLLLLPLPKNSYAFDWQDLWQSKDQQAQKAYQQQQYGKAAELFSNPDWQAAAHYKAGDYEKAQAALKNNESALSTYNQGNALAQAGKLQEAIEAYKKALALDPNDADAQYNKDLVEKELQKQQQQKQEQPQNQQQNKDKDSSENNPQQKNQEQQGQSEQPQSSESGDSGQKPEQKAEKTGADQMPEAQQKQGQDGETEDDQKKADGQQAQPKQEKDQSKNGEEKSTGEADLSAEQKQANEQWLKRIPDDPSGLLKRKFKYQYGQQGRERTNRQSW
ncbi:VWA domain-containing protein [Methylosoma difficile]